MKNNSAELQKRNSSIELLRIICGFMVILLHFVGKGGITSQEIPNALSVNYIVGFTIKSFSIVAVNIFVLITGYFGIEQKGLKIRKVFDIVLITAFWSFVCYALGVFLQLESFSFGKILNSLLPCIFDKNKLWYVSCYLLLLVLSPFLNLLLKSLSKRSYVSLLVVIILAFSIFPMVCYLYYHSSGYDIIQMVLMYSIGGFLRLHIAKKPSKQLCIAIYAICSIITLLFAYFCNQAGKFYSYDSIFVILGAVFFFALFLQLNIDSKVINTMSKGVFSVYILSVFADYNTVYDYFFDNVMCRKLYFDSNLFLPHLLICTISFFIISLLLDFLRRILFKYSVDRILDKVSIANKVFFV